MNALAQFPTDTQRSIDKARAMSSAWDRAFTALSKRDTPAFDAAMAEFRQYKETV